jgi:hypothetical protein
MKGKKSGNQLRIGIITLGFFVAIFLNSQVFAAKPKVPKTKIGATHHTHNTGDFTLSEQGTTNTGSASGNLVGFALFAERLFFDRFSAGLKYGYGLERSMQMLVGTNTLEILENASFWALEFKAFVKDNLRPGIKPFLGVSYGNYSVVSTISILPTTGSVTEDQTGATIPFTTLSAGADYTFGLGGIRAEVGQVTGKRNDLEGSSTYYASYNYDGTVIGISVYSFF